MLAKFSETLYDGRVRKNIIVFVFFILSFLISFFIFPHKALAVCTVNVDPNPIVDKFYGNVILRAIDDTCLGVGVRYTIFAYPQGMTLDTLKRSSLSSVKGGSSSNDGQTLNVSLDFKDILGSSRGGPGIRKPHTLGPWAILVCSSNACEGGDRVAQGEFNLAPIPPVPTPTPPSDLPIIDYTKQDSCVFQESYNPNSFITIKIENIDPKTEYVWWWDNRKQEKATLDLIPQETPTPSLSSTDSLESLQDNVQLQETPTPSPTPLLYELKIPKSELQNLKNLKHEGGHLLCIDIPNIFKTMGKERMRVIRTGANCLRLFFTSATPEGDTTCTEANSGEISPTPKPHLTPCANWVYFNNIPVPTSTEQPQTQEEYIRQNNLRNQIKCAEIFTGIGPIKTDPFGFVKSILSVILSLAGGITVLLIIVSGYRLTTSQGNPEAVQAAREQLTSAIVGFLFIIFSLVILQVIGVDILHIPGFTK